MTTVSAPIDMVWERGVMRPISPFWARRAERQWTVGEVYAITDNPERSSKAHAFYFASVGNAWKSLPDHMAERFPSADHLRRYALIKSGFCDTQSMPCGTHAAAMRFAAFVRPIDEFALVTVTGSVMNVFRAKSQSMRAMGRDEFNRSKDTVLAVLADMIEVSPKVLAKQVAE